MLQVLELREIVEAGMWAPSGDDTQPWRFVANHEGIDVHLDPASLHSIYDYKERGSLVAIGTSLENISIAARHFGKTIEITLYPNPDDPNYVARVAFTGDVGAGTPDDARLYDLIPKRGTNRKHYTGVPLTAEQRAVLLDIPRRVEIDGQVRLVEDPEQRRALAKLFTTSDKLPFMSRAMHDGLFDCFRWTKKQIETTRDGIDIRTLEFAPFDVFGLRLLRSWLMTRFLSLFGISSIIGKKTEATYASASAMCAIVMKGSDDIDFIKGGRIMQRLWLEATSMGLAIQPSFGFALLGERALDNDTSIFSPAHVAFLKNAFNKTRDIFNIGDETITMLFRIGTPTAAPSARALRKYPEAIVEYRA